MPKKPIPTKSSFGGCDVAHLSPKPAEDGPKAVNIVIPFEEALKLHLSLGQVLGKLRRCRRSAIPWRGS